MSKIPELMSGRKLEHSANIIGDITTQRGVVAGPAAKVGGQILDVQNVTLTAIVDTVLGSVDLPASPDGVLPGTLTAGTLIRVRAVGRNSNNAGANNLTLNVKLGANTYSTLTANPAANDYIYIQADIHILSVGASGGVIATGRSKVGSGGESTSITANTVNTTVANTVSLTGSWDVAESFALGNLSVEIVGN